MRNWVYKSLSDEALMKKYSKGSTCAFDYLYLRNKDALFLFLNRQCNNRSVAEELAHDTWIAVINRAENYQSNAKFKTWLFRIAHNRLVDYWRKYGTSSQQILDEISNQLLVNSEPSINQLELEDIFKSLEVLSVDQMEVLLLKIEGFSHFEISKITNAKQETVKSRLRYAVKHLRTVMEATS